ncbi:MAG: DivIVA domain-containing protein [Ilumatobacteraceae bacterium]
MDLSPQAVAAATFRTVKRGYDPDEVRAYLIEVSASLEASHQQATAMEARARAAIQRLQDATHTLAPPPITGQVPVTPPSPTKRSHQPHALLAQRTADTTIAEAQAEAASITGIRAGRGHPCHRGRRGQRRQVAGRGRGRGRSTHHDRTHRSRTDHRRRQRPGRSTRRAAEQESSTALEQARAEAARVLDEARAEAHRAKSEQHLRAEAEVADLQAPP